MRFISFSGRFASSLFFSMSASLNALESNPIAEVQSDEEEVVNIAALTQQLQEAQLRNERITKKKQEQADAKAKKLQEEKDEADRLAQEEAKRKTEKVNKRKRVSAVLKLLFGLRLIFGLGLENDRGTGGTGRPKVARGRAEYGGGGDD